MSAIDKQILVETVSIAALRLSERNPRSHSKGQIRQLARSIERFGFNVPILVDGTNGIIAGHGRLLALQRLGRNNVPIIRLDHLTEAEVKAYQIADNKLALNATWDDQLL